MNKLDAHVIQDDKAVVNVGKYGGYVMVESIPSDSRFHKLVLITVVNDIGDVIHEYELNLAVNDRDIPTLTEGESK